MATGFPAAASGVPGGAGPTGRSGASRARTGRPRGARRRGERKRGPPLLASATATPVTLQTSVLATGKLAPMEHGGEEKHRIDFFGELDRGGNCFTVRFLSSRIHIRQNSLFTNKGNIGL